MGGGGEKGGLHAVKKVTSMSCLSQSIRFHFFLWDKPGQGLPPACQSENSQLSHAPTT